MVTGLPVPAVYFDFTVNKRLYHTCANGGINHSLIESITSLLLSHLLRFSATCHEDISIACLINFNDTRLISHYTASPFFTTMVDFLSKTCACQMFSSDMFTVNRMLTPDGKKPNAGWTSVRWKRTIFVYFLHPWALHLRIELPILLANKKLTAITLRYSRKMGKNLRLWSRRPQEWNRRLVLHEKRAIRLA